MDKKYIKIAGIYKKIRKAESEQKTIYISGPVGYGKTTSVENYFSKKDHIILNGSEGFLNMTPELSTIDGKVVIIDDISWIVSQDSIQYILDLVDRYSGQIVLIGRSKIPKWLRVSSVQKRFILADEKDLEFSEKEAKELFAQNGIELSDDEFNKAYAETEGHALTLSYLVNHLIKRNTYENDIMEEVKMEVFHYFDQAFYEKWDSEMKQVLMELCQYPQFNVEMAELITGNNRIPFLLEKAISIGTFLQKHENNIYSYNQILRYFLQWKQSLLYTKKQIQENYERAALYFEMHDNIEKALFYYQKANNEKRISNLLIKNAEKHPGTAHFFETRSYYFSLPREVILESPVLMSGMSMLYSITLCPQQCEEWYQELVKYEQNAPIGSAERKEAKIRLAYLDIALPNRGIHGIINIIKNTAIICKNKNITTPEFSVTSNMPSIMNGGLDFCDWSKNDKELAILMKKPIEVVLGKYGVGLVNIAMAESGFVKGTMEPYEISTRLNTGYMKSDMSGKIEMCFAATGLMVREHIANGQFAIGENLMKSFYEKAKREKAIQLLPNIETYCVWLQLINGNIKPAKEWLVDAPDENIAFCVLDRYRYMNKIRCYIAMGQLDVALGLIERLNVYFTEYERHYLWMENQILKSIVLYRLNQKNWKSVLIEAIKKMEQYNFVRIIAEEGIAIKPLLDQIKDQKIKPQFLKRIKAEVNNMAVYYPNYLKEEKRLIEPLTETERKIVKLLCSKVSSKEICNLCFISYSGLKFHNNNIYKKLGVNNRNDAELEAIRLGLDK